MAGLLGDSWDDPRTMAALQLAGGLLGGGGFGQALGRGLTAYQQTMTADEERKAVKAQREMQAANIASEIETRKSALEKQQWMQGLARQMYPGAGVGTGAPQQLGTASGAAGAAGAAGSGVGPAPGGPDGMFDPRRLAALKLAGIDLVDVAKLAQPNWQNINGNMVNTNDPAFRGGFQPGMQVSANGQATMWQPDGQGGLVVGAPRGALDTYAAYQNAGERSKNQNTLAPLDRIDRTTGQPYATTVDGLIQMVNGGGMQPQRQPAPMPGQPANVPAIGQPPMRPQSAGEAGMRQSMSGSMGNAPSDYDREIRAVQNDLMRPGLDTQSRAMLQEHLAGLLATRQQLGGTSGAPLVQQQPTMGRMSNDPRRLDYAGAPAPAGGLPTAQPGGFNGFAGPGDITRMNEQAKADVVRGTEKTKSGDMAGDMLANLARARELLGQHPTESYLGSFYDQAAGLVGVTPRGAGPAAQLKAIGAWLSATVPKAPGDQSEKELANYMAMTGLVGDSTKPVSVRLDALNEVERLQRGSADRNTLPVRGPGGAAQPPAAAPLPPNSTASSLQRGQRYALPNGRVGVWDGMRFKAE